jgi:hypothetical protein
MVRREGGTTRTPEHFVKILEGAGGGFTQNLKNKSAASFYDLFFTIVFQNSKIYILWDD